MHTAKSPDDMAVELMARLATGRPVAVSANVVAIDRLLNGRYMVEIALSGGNVKVSLSELIDPQLEPQKAETPACLGRLTGA